MGRCPNCNKEGYEERHCFVCGKQVCSDCGWHLFDIWRYGDLPSVRKYHQRRVDGSPSSECHVCSKKCYDEFLGEMKEVVTKAEVIRISREEVYWRNFLYGHNTAHGTPLRYSDAWVPREIGRLAYVSWFKKHNEINEWVMALQGRTHTYREQDGLMFRFVFEITNGDEIPSDLSQARKAHVPPKAHISHELYKEAFSLFQSKFTSAPSGSMPTGEEKGEEERKETERLNREYALLDRKQDEKKEQEFLSSISYCERVGRYEEAAKDREKLAQIYERWASYDKAREQRDGARRLLGKGPQVVVDLNKLIQQVKDSGIVAVYRCPHCGGTLKVGKNTNAESVKVCEHCGSEIETMDLANFLRTALS